MTDPPRRRRRSELPPRREGGEFPLIPAILVVILVGLGIGAALAHFIGAPQVSTGLRTVRPTALPTAAPTPIATVTALAVQTPTPARSLSPTPSATPAVVPATATPKPTPSPAPSASPSPSPTTSPTKAPAATPSAVASATPPKRRTLPVGRRPETPASPTASPAVSAADVVRRYIVALRNGNRALASSYLAHGSIEQDYFIDASAKITSISTVRNADGTTEVEANVRTVSGAYAMNFNVADGRITSHSTLASP